MKDYKNDVMRVSQIRNIGALEDNKPVSDNEWEKLKSNGEESIKKWSQRSTLKSKIKNRKSKYATQVAGL